MDKITLGEIATALAFLVALGGSIVAIITAFKKALKKLLDDQLKAIIDRLNRTDENSRVGLRPNLSLSHPATATPAMTPIFAPVFMPFFGAGCCTCGCIGAP